jgi:hypothetical protein
MYFSVVSEADGGCLMGRLWFVSIETHGEA